MDNPALHAARQAGLLPVPVYIHDENNHAWSLGGASAWWLHHSLTDLQQSLRNKGSDLIVMRGESGAQLVRLAKATNAGDIFWNRGYEPHARAVDDKIQRILTEHGITSHTFNATLLAEPAALLKKDHTPYRVFTPFWNNLLRLYTGPPLTPAPRRLPALPVSAGRPDIQIKTLALLPSIPWDQDFYKHWSPGEAGAHRRLKGFTHNALADYPHDRELPGLEGTSRLSPHLHFGEISPHRVWSLLQEYAALHQSAGISRACESFLRQLVWREFAHHLLYHFPHTAEQPLDPRFSKLPWRRQYQKQLRRWQEGETGIPIVDAGMRELWSSGWMHNRVRMIAASLLTKNLLIPWQEGTRWFWDTLVDADLANNTLGWQWTAGCGADAAPYFRVFNPVTQGERFDPQGDYIRRWIPELGRIPAKWIHQPWAAPGQILKEANIRPGKDYPKPIVELSQSRIMALAAWDKIRRS